MQLLLNKMRLMNKKPQQYHPKSQKFFPHPPSLRFSETSHKQFEIDKSNEYLYGRISTAKGSYTADKQLQSYERSKYYESQILKNSKYANPFLNYVTPHTYEKKLYKYILSENKRKQEEAEDNRYKRYNTSYNERGYSASSNNRSKSKGKECSKSSFNERAFSALSRNSNKTITIERSVISARSREQGSAKERINSAYTNKRQHTQGYEDVHYDEKDEFDIKEDNDNVVHAKTNKQEAEYENNFYEDNEEVVDDAKMDEDNNTKSNNNNHYKNATTTETYGQIATTS